MKHTHTFAHGGRFFQGIITQTEIDVDWDEEGRPIEYLWNWDLIKLPAGKNPVKIDEGVDAGRQRAVVAVERAARLYMESDSAVAV